MALILVAFSNLADAHPFLAWCALWVLWMLWFIATLCVNSSVRLVGRLLRTLNIAFRGWPPAHLDADGDAIESETYTAGDLSVTRPAGERGG